MGKFKFLLFAVVALALTSAMGSCKEDEDPTELDETTLSTNASISGYVTYHYTDGKDTEYESAKKGTKVVLKYSYASGEETFNFVKETETNKGGKYSFNVLLPAGVDAKCEISTYFEGTTYAVQKGATEADAVKATYVGKWNGTLTYGDNLVADIEGAVEGVTEDAFYN